MFASPAPWLGGSCHSCPPPPPLPPPLVWEIVFSIYGRKCFGKGFGHDFRQVTQLASFNPDRSNRIMVHFLVPDVCMKKFWFLLHLKSKKGFIAGLGRALGIVDISIGSIEVKQSLASDWGLSVMRGSSGLISMPTSGSMADKGARWA